MKATSQINLFFIAIAILLSSCYPAHYATNDAYSLGLSQQGDIKVAGSYLGGKNGNSFNQEQKKFYQYYKLKILICKRKLTTSYWSHISNLNKVFYRHRND